MKQINRTTHKYSVSPIQPDFSYISVLTAARIERADFIHGVLVRLSRRIGRGLIAPFAAMRRRQRVYEEMMSLDDHVLADIGISRSDIPYLVRKSANQGGADGNNGTRAA